jgi:hypothetical protein
MRTASPDRNTSHQPPFAFPPRARTPRHWMPTRQKLLRRRLLLRVPDGYRLCGARANSDGQQTSSSSTAQTCTSTRRFIRCIPASRPSLVTPPSGQGAALAALLPLNKWRWPHSSAQRSDWRTDMMPWICPNCWYHHLDPESSGRSEPQSPSTAAVYTCPICHTRLRFDPVTRHMRVVESDASDESRVV